MHSKSTKYCLGSELMADDKILRDVYEVLESRRDCPIDSYTSNIMKDSDKNDLIFHTLLLLAYKGVEFDEILEEFERRRK